MSAELLPCPLCSGRAASGPCGENDYWAGCARPGCAVVRGVSLDAVVELWNRRADESRIRADAAAERTREIVAWFHNEADEWAAAASDYPVGNVNRTYRAGRAHDLRARVFAIQQRYPDAFPPPKEPTR